MKKLSIVFAMHYEVGHIVCAFKLAKKLQYAGHGVTFLSIPDRKSLIESHGFNVISFVDDIMPLGYNNKKFPTHREQTAIRRVHFCKFSR